MLTKSKRVNIKNAWHVAIDVDKLCEGKHLPFDVFYSDKSVINPLFEKGMFFTSISKDGLKAKGIFKVLVRVSDIEDNDAYFVGAKTGSNSFYDDPAVFRQYSFSKDQHHQIDRMLLVPGTSINFSLYLLSKFSISPLVEATLESPARIPDDALSVSGDIVIKKDDIPLYFHYLGSLAGSGNISSEQKSGANLTIIKEKAKIIFRDFFDSPAALARMAGTGIKEKAKIRVRDVLNNPKSGEKIIGLKSSINDMIDSMLENRNAVYGLLSLKGHDFFIYTHSLNVAALAINLGIDLNIKRDALEKLGLGAILHDIGESVIAPYIVHRQGRLNESEYKMFRNHVLEGEKILRNQKEFPAESMPAVLQHHEKLSGRGYPYRLSGNDIKTFGRITAIADCFDALTTRRPFKTALAPFAALSVIAEETENYDHEFLKIFIRTLGKLE